MCRWAGRRDGWQARQASRTLKEQKMSEYLVLLYENEQALVNEDQATTEQVFKEHMAFVQANGEAVRGGNALQFTDTATSIRSDGNGSFLVTDGAFAETKEILSGYYLIEAADLDEAIAIAKQVP